MAFLANCHILELAPPLPPPKKKKDEQALQKALQALDSIQPCWSSGEPPGLVAEDLLMRKAYHVAILVVAVVVVVTVAEAVAVVVTVTVTVTLVVTGTVTVLIVIAIVTFLPRHFIC